MTFTKLATYSASAVKSNFCNFGAYNLYTPVGYLLTSRLCQAITPDVFDCTHLLFCMLLQPWHYHVTSGQSNLTWPHHRRKRTVHLYSPGGANVHPNIVHASQHSAVLTLAPAEKHYLMPSPGNFCANKPHNIRPINRLSIVANSSDRGLW